ncbi:discoidin domain-containing protein [bacterium]|nr:discoidin domain-containing protein [bacterium]
MMKKTATKNKLFDFKPSFTPWALLFCLTLCLAGASRLYGQPFTRGIGVYPGDPAEDFSPVMRLDTLTYRNIAQRRPVYQSSAYDYNLTGQLATDGIRDTALPAWIAVSAGGRGMLKKNEREWMFDENRVTTLELEGPEKWIELELAGAEAPLVDSLAVSGSLQADDREPAGWKCAFLGSDDGSSWTELGRLSGAGLPGDTLPGRFGWFRRPRFRVFNHAVALKSPVRYRFYRIEWDAQNATRWSIGEWDFFNSGRPVPVGGPHRFTSAWKSAGNRNEWICVDLGATCSLDRVMLHWISKPATGSVQLSQDAADWIDALPIPPNPQKSDTLRWSRPQKARYVRIYMQRAASRSGFILSEMEVFGRGGPVPVPESQAASMQEGRMNLAGGPWRLQRESLVRADGALLSKPGFQDSGWVTATVPATVLMSFKNAGAIPDPNFGDNQLLISDSFFHSDFWYRTEFTPDASLSGRRIFLNFDGINWKAEVFLNGLKLGRIEGGFMRGRFDVTGTLAPGKVNALAVRIEKNRTPGSVKEKTYQNPDKNGGALGADNPTYHASIGWDWIPTIRGRNIGIWNDVYLTAADAVTIEKPYVRTVLPLPDTSRADISLDLLLQNHEPAPITGKLCVRIGKTAFEMPVNLEASAAKSIHLDLTTQPGLRIQKPKLWWPAGYGEQNLVPVEIRFETDNGISDSKSFLTGLRQMTFSEEGGDLRIWINGRRLIAKGGNWGFPESNLCYRGREYDIAVAYHQDQHFTMIRNWVGQTGDDEFYEACDRHGVMVWQDFWLANPADGPDPDDNGMFLRNAEDLILRVRNHPSMALYCGRNEGNPPEILDSGLRDLIKENHPDLHYIPNSAWGPVSGGGPYRAMPLKHYFERRATKKLHSEMGMPAIVHFESLKSMMPDSALWPQGRMWGLHDFCLEGAQGGNSFNQMMKDGFGEFDNAADWTGYAQWINYQGYRAMFEAQAKHRMGLLLWMSHPAWPSFVWQTYDYFFDPTAAYFGCRKACEPLHIQWNPATDSVEVVNTSSRKGDGLKATATLLNLDGSLQWEKSVSLSCGQDAVVRCLKLEYPQQLSEVYFIRLKLSRKGRTVSENFYWRGLEENHFKALRSLPSVTLKSKVKVKLEGGVWSITAELSNPSVHPAPMIRLKAAGEKSGGLILPVFFSDNYISLMPGEKRSVCMTVKQEDTRGEKPVVLFEGVNVK